jgi:predicted ester cyclase
LLGALLSLPLVGSDRLIDEMVFKCTHTTEIDWLVPGIPPTGKPLEIALVGVVAFRGDKLTFEYVLSDHGAHII